MEPKTVFLYNVLIDFFVCSVFIYIIHIAAIRRVINSCRLLICWGARGQPSPLVLRVWYITFRVTNNHLDMGQYDRLNVFAIFPFKGTSPQPFVCL